MKVHLPLFQGMKQEEQRRLCLCSLLFCCALVGCQSSTTTPKAPPLRYVRMERLTALHPLSVSHNIEGAERQAGVGPIQLPPSFTPLTANTTLPDTRSEERQQNIVVQTDSLRKQYAILLAQADAQRIEREVNLKQKELNALYRRAVSDLAAKLSADEGAHRAYITTQIQNLGYYEVIYKTAFEQQGTSAREAYLAKLERVRKQIRALQALLDKPKPDTLTLAETALKGQKAEVERQVKAFRNEITQKAQEEYINTLTQESVDLKAELQSISPISQAIAMQEGRHTLPQIVPLAQQSVYTKGRDNQAQASAFQKRTRDSSLTIRDKVIQKDTLQAVDAYFALRGWKRVEVGTRGATDATEEVVSALKHP